MGGRSNHDVEFEVLPAVDMKSSIFWDVMPCSLVKAKHVSG
jgi:hypothetical protein